MSHILIKNVVMPHNCHECDALGISDIVGLVCNDKNAGYSFKKRPKTCPLVEMSPEFPIEELRLQVVYLAGMIAAEQKWVPVTERLPEEDKEVLITYKGKGDELDKPYSDIDITTYGQMYFGGNKVGNYKHWRSPFQYFNGNYEVTAWMPLPEPYHPEGGQK